MKIMIVDDQKILRDCIKYMIEHNSDIEVVACASDGNEAYELYRKYLPDVILMDVLMPVCDGIEATKRIKDVSKDVKILILTTSIDNENVDIAIKSGADGYILKSIGAEELILSIKGVYAGLDIFHKDIYKTTCEFTDDQHENASVDRPLEVNGINIILSERELRIIRFVVDGKSIQEIAKILFLAEGRVRNIITEIISKLMLKDRAQLVAFAFKNKLV
ncbi:MAG: response regulator transcription factor [Bacillota bacterium]